MAPGIQVVAHATQSWLKSSWHIQVPTAWLEACVEWLQEEAGGAGRLSQQQINQQVLDQWLLTDLRDLDHTVLPEGICQAQKTELSGNFCVQVDSLLDISQPAYSQLQSWKGTDCTNDEVSAVTQITQRPWEARATRMLLLQVTDGVQSLEAMEYEPIPALSTALRPGVKLQLKGKMVCRLGMLLLGPSNVKILGGEVEDLVEKNNQGRVLCRTLGLPEEEQQQQQEQGEGAPQAQQEVEDLELVDAELLANLEAEEVALRVPAWSVQDSGYRTLSETSSQSSIRSAVSTVSSRSNVLVHSHRNVSAQNSRGGPLQDRHRSIGQDYSELFDLAPPEGSLQREIPHHNMTDEDFPDEDFPLDQLDAVIVQQNKDVSSSSHGSTGNASIAIKSATSNGSQSCLGSSDSGLTMQERNNQSYSRETTEQFPCTAANPSQQLESFTNDEHDFMDDDIDFLQEIEAPNQLLVEPGKAKTKRLSYNCGPSSSLKTETHQGHSITSSTERADRFLAKEVAQSESSGPALSLTSPPFTYLCLLEEQMSKQNNQPTEICVKAFIVTLLGKLSSSSGLWRVCATISDGTGYLDVELSNEVLMGLLGFSVAEKAVLKRDPARKGELDTGMKRCQEELVDMCCIMTIVVEPEGRKAVVTKADPVSGKVLQELEQRVGERK